MKSEITMRRFHQTDLRLMLIAALMVLGATFVGLPKTLGAHHFWSVQVGLTGLALGLAGSVLLRLTGLGRRRAAIAQIVVLVLASAAAVIGKRRFVASFAEDAVAGQFWYFGWIAAIAAMTALIITLLLRDARATS